MQRNDIILVDTCVVIEAIHRGYWKQLHSNFRLETVEYCLVEVQTGRTQRLAQPISEAELRECFHQVHPVSELDVLRALDDHDLGHLDKGEQELWVHALQRDDAWLLSGPDEASMKFGCSAGHRDRLVSLEKALEILGVRDPRLQSNYQNTWLEGVKRRHLFGLL